MYTLVVIRHGESEWNRKICSAAGQMWSFLTKV